MQKFKFERKLPHLNGGTIGHVEHILASDKRLSTVNLAGSDVDSEEMEERHSTSSTVSDVSSTFSEKCAKDEALEMRLEMQGDADSVRIAQLEAELNAIKNPIQAAEQRLTSEMKSHAEKRDSDIDSESEVTEYSVTTNDSTTFSEANKRRQERIETLTHTIAANALRIAQLEAELNAIKLNPINMQNSAVSDVETKTRAEGVFLGARLVVEQAAMPDLDALRMDRVPEERANGLAIATSKREEAVFEKRK